MAPTRVARLVRDAVYARSKHRCEICGVKPAGNLHHRVPRGMGGTRAAWINQAPNLIAVCGSGTTGCHGLIEAGRSVAFYYGWIVRRGIVLPADVPTYLYVDGVQQWVTLTDDAEYAESKALVE